MRFFIYFVCLFSFFGFVSSASADVKNQKSFFEGATPVNDPMINSFLFVAQSYWGRSPDVNKCPGDGVAVTVFDFKEDPGVWASATMPGCEINLEPEAYPMPSYYVGAVNAEMWRGSLCTVIVHEWGHMLGLDHSSDPNDLMAPFVSFVLPDCKVAAAQTDFSAFTSPPFIGVKAPVVNKPPVIVVQSPVVEVVPSPETNKPSRSDLTIVKNLKKESTNSYLRKKAACKKFSSKKKVRLCVERARKSWVREMRDINNMLK